MLDIFTFFITRQSGNQFFFKIAVKMCQYCNDKIMLEIIVLEVINKLSVYFDISSP